MSRRGSGKSLAVHLGVIVLLLLAQFVLSAYQHGNVARIMLLAVYAVGYNLLLGYTGLMSLGHAMFFAAGMYGAGLPVYYLGFGALPAFFMWVFASVVLATLFGIVAMRTSGVSFLIVTLMFAQVFFLLTLYFNEITLGDQGFVLSKHLGPIEFAGLEFKLSDPAVKYNGAWLMLSVSLLLSLALTRTPSGRVLVAVRKNEERTCLLGYDTFKYKLLAKVGLSAARAQRADELPYGHRRLLEIAMGIAPTRYC